MCGIMGYVGTDNGPRIVLKGLEKLEYRGYDSAGIAFEISNKFSIIKTIGSPANLKEKINTAASHLCIGHTRWATHGEASETNAHPHTSSDGMFAIVHNGIIENYEQLKNELINSGKAFKSQTDSEVIAHLLEANYHGDFKGAVTATLSQLKGSYALGIICSDYPDTIICAKKSSPLFVGTSDSGSFLSSDVSALADNAERVFRINDYEIGIIKKDDFKVYDFDGCRIRKTEISVKKEEYCEDKLNFRHYMLKEIYEQPAAIQQTINEFIEGNKIRFKALKWSKKDIKDIDSVLFIACGSAYYAGMAGAYASEAIFRRSSKAEIASEFIYKNPKISKNTLVIIISQSGETADTLSALKVAKEKGAKTVSIVNVENSTIAIESDNVAFTKAGKEIAVATTKAYTAQLAVIYSLVIYLSVLAEELDKKTALKYIEELKSIPQKVSELLNNAEAYSKASDMIINKKFTCFIGRNNDYCAAAEGALKLKEVSYIPCEAYPAGELKHGTISLIDTGSVVIALDCSDRLRDKITNNINEIKARCGTVIRISTDKENSDITIPETLELFTPLLTAIPLQLIAYFTAAKKGCSIDKPRNLAKSVTVE